MGVTFLPLYNAVITRLIINITCRNSISIAMPQSERAFQKQPTVFQNRKRLPGVKKGAVKRYTTNVGLGFKTPREVRCFKSKAN